MMLPPYPGSDEARTEGCICAVLDNNHGLYPARPPDGWWVTQGCPVHTYDLVIDTSDSPLHIYDIDTSGMT